VSLGDVAQEVRNGISTKPDASTGIPILRISAIRPMFLNSEDVRFLQPADEWAAYRLVVGDLLFTRYNGNPSLVGVCACVRKTDLDGQAGLVYPDKLIRVRVSPEVADPGFVERAAHSEPARRFIQGKTKTSAGQVGVSGADLKALPISLPPLNEQRRIVAKLDAVFKQTRAARTRLERLPALLDKLKRSILAAAFRGDLTADWRAANPDVEPASALLDRLHTEHRRRWEEAGRAKGKVPSPTAYRLPTKVESEALGELPPGWVWASVDDLAELQLGQQRAPVHANAEKTHPYVRAANIKWDGLDLTDVKEMGFPDLERYRLRYGDVLLSEASGSPSEVGKPAIWRDEIPGCCYQKTLLRARPRSVEVTSEWLHAAFLADALLGRFARMAPGVGILHLTADRMLGWPVPLAPVEEQRVLVERLRGALDAVSRLEHTVAGARQNAERVEQATLSRAFRGELVEQDPADEPAAALLDRLRTSATIPAARSARTKSRSASGKGRTAIVGAEGEP
jgi:type I restriction enzyme S subunit